MNMFKRTAQLTLRKFASNSTNSSKTFLTEDIMQAARKKIQEKGFESEKVTESSLNQESSIGSYLLTGLFLGGVFGGTYMLCRTVKNEPQSVTNSPWYQKPFSRAYYRTLLGYKSLIDPDTDCLLPDPYPIGHPLYRPYTLCIELEKLLVHSSWSKELGWSVQKRPWAEYFLAYMSQFFEIVIFTTQNSSYAAPVIDKLDGNLRIVTYRLYRDSTRYDLATGNYIKDLSILNRDLRNVILMDCDEKHWTGSQCQPENVIELNPWTGDPEDSYLLDIIPFMEILAQSGFDDLRPILMGYKGKDIPKVFAQNLARIRAEEKLKAVSSSTLDGILSYIGLGAPKIPSEKEFAELQLVQHTNFINRLNEVKQISVEESKADEEKRNEVMEKAKGKSIEANQSLDIRVTLVDLMIYGIDEAVKRKAPEDVRAYLEEMQRHAQGLE